MPESLFISDLHLGADTPRTLAQFQDFMRRRAPRADRLYILGDLFEAWVGDDDPSSVHQRIDNSIRELVDSGTSVFFMHGNRDFLIAEQFASRTRCRLLDDPWVVDLYGTTTLLTHGDRLCTDDRDHQTYREQTSTDAWKNEILARPLEERLAMAKEARAKSRGNKQIKLPEIMDVNEEAALAAMRDSGAQRLIHGHTHKPAIHRFELDGIAAERIVLPDWDTCPGALVCTPDETYLEQLEPK